MVLLIQLLCFSLEGLHSTDIQQSKLHMNGSVSFLLMHFSQYFLNMIYNQMLGMKRCSK